MTAPEPTRPADEHTDAVARRMSTREWGEWSSAYHADFNRWTWDGDGRTDMERAEFRDYADAVLTSTDAAVHAAMLDALVRAGVLPDTEALRHHLAIAESDASQLAATIRDARESLTRNRGRGAGWEKVSQALRPMGLSDALARAERRGRVRAMSAQPNPRFGQVAP